MRRIPLHQASSTPDFGSICSESDGMSSALVFLLLSCYLFLVIQDRIMAFTQSDIAAENGHVGPHPSYIQLAKPYIFEQKLQECMAATGVTEAKEDNIRLQGVAWIDSLRKALHLYEKPIKIYQLPC